ARFAIGGELGARGVDVAVTLERRGILADLVFPDGEVHAERFGGALTIGLGLDGRKIAGFVGLLGLYLDVGAHGDELLVGALVAEIGVVPQQAADGIGVVVYGHRIGAEVVHEDGGSAADAVGVVQLEVADAEIDGEHAAAGAAVGAEQGAEVADGAGG